jgi:hypothetical protein
MMIGCPFLRHRPAFSLRASSSTQALETHRFSAMFDSKCLAFVGEIVSSRVETIPFSECRKVAVFI